MFSGVIKSTVFTKSYTAFADGYCVSVDSSPIAVVLFDVISTVPISSSFHTLSEVTVHCVIFLSSIPRKTAIEFSLS